MLYQKQDVSDQVIEGVAKARLLTREEVEKAMNDAPLTPEQGLKYNLLDGIKYRCVTLPCASAGSCIAAAHPCMPSVLLPGTNTVCKTSSQ